MPNGNQFQYDPSQFGITGMSPEYLRSIMADIQRRGRQTYGQVTARGTAAGMEYDDPTMGIRQQAAISGTQREMGSTLGGLSFQSWQVQQQQLEREKDRQLQLQVARMGGRGGYRPPIQYGKVPSLGGGPVIGGGDPMAGAGGPAIQRRVEAAYNPPVVRAPTARPAYARRRY